MSVSALPTSASASTPALVKMASGEYTAASVSADPTDATKLDLVKETDGNYGTTPPAPTGAAAAVQSSPTVLASLASLKLGGN
jgi:hypothetical protein